ncbi:MAG: alpha/beta hydrolase [Anaerolineae bacterium]
MKHPYFLPGSSTGCLLVHGFTGSPANLRWLGEHLNAQGFTVHGVRLAGHGYDVADLNRVRWREWVYSAREGLYLLREHCDRIAIIGFSMGGAISYIVAADENPDCLVTLGAPHKIHHPLLPLVPFVSPFVQSIPKPGLDTPAEKELDQRVTRIQAERGAPQLGVVRLQVWPLPALNQLNQLLRESRAALPRITAPTLLLHGERDETVPFGDLSLNVAALGSLTKHTQNYPQSGHHLALDVEREQVYAAVADFVREYADVE